MKNILFIITNIIGQAQESRRSREFINYWKKHYKITILTKDNFDNDIFNHPNIEVIKIPYSLIGKIIITNPKFYKNSESNNKSIKLRSRLRKIIRNLWRRSQLQKFIFPDKYIFELKSFEDKMLQLLKNRRYHIVIIKAAPFSLMKLSKVVKETNANIECIYDTGDPFYGNCVRTLIEPFQSIGTKRFENKYLKYIDTIIVPSMAVKNHYKNNFNDFLNNTEIKVINQGISQIKKIRNKQNYNENSVFTLIYAGGLHKKIREPFELYKAIEEIDDLEIKLKIFGNIYEDLLPDLKNKRFYFGGTIPNELVIREYLTCDVIVFIDNSFGVEVPGKILEVISTKKPILFIYENEKSPSFEYIESYRGYFKTKNNKDSIISAIQYIKENYNKFSFIYDLSAYYWENLAKRYSRIF